MATPNIEFFSEAQPSQLSLFSLPPTQTAVDNIYYQEVRPISQLSGSTPIEFNVTGNNGLEYIDLRQSTMYVKVKIINSDGSSLSATQYVGPVNLFLQSLFTQVDVTVQGKIITSATGHYPYKAMIQNLLGYGTESKTSQLTTQLWLKDTAEHMDDNNVNSGQNTGLYERARYFAESKTVDMAGPIIHDLFKLDRYILNQVGISVKFYRSKPEFCLTTNELAPEFTVHIEDMVLRICKVQVNLAVIYGHAQVLQKTNCKYPFNQTEVRMFAIPQGLVNFTWDNVFQGFKPKRVVIGFVNSQAVAGSFSLSPWNFRGYDLSQISVSVNGIPAGGNPIKLNFNASLGSTTIDVLTAMFQTTGKWLKDVGNQIDRDDVTGGYALYAFDLEPTFQDGNYLTLLKQGNVRIDAQFNKSLPHPVTCIVYSERSGYFEINLAREVLVQ